MAPRLLGVAAVQVNFLVNTILASAQPQGSLTAITIAWAVMTMPQVVIAQAIAIAALPTFSAQVSLGRLEEMRASLAATLRGVVFLSLPASLGLILLRRQVIALLFQRGEFDASSTELVAWALLWYAVGLVGHSVVEILARAFYALHDTRTPVLVGVAAMGLNLLLSVTFSTLFRRMDLPPHGGLALANSLATALEMVGLLLLMRRRLGGLHGTRIWQGVGQAALATLAMSLGLWVWLVLSDRWTVGWVVAGGLLLGAGVYGMVLLATRGEEALGLARALRMALKQVFQ
jgi:putative peptidoglycan lipid II flippase